VVFDADIPNLTAIKDLFCDIGIEVLDEKSVRGGDPLPYLKLVTEYNVLLIIQSGVLIEGDEATNTFQKVLIQFGGPGEAGAKALARSELESAACLFELYVLKAVYLNL
jgi:hypothetical protein